VSVTLDQIFDESDRLADELLAIIDLPLTNETARVETSHIACSLSLEHWHSARVLLRAALLPSALVVHRAQFESVTRSVWLAYAASDERVSKFASGLSLEAEQAAKNMPMLNDMVQEIEQTAPRPAYEALARFKANSWKALNSYAHAGIHPLRRHRDGYPVALLHGILCNANGLAVISCMQAVVLSGEQPLQKDILDVAAKHPTCMPPPL